MKYVINLLPEKNQQLADRIIYFSFHYLRYILVITQFVAICTFFYRFKVDQEIVDLRDIIKQRTVIVESNKPLLKEVDRLDNKMTHISRMLSQQRKTLDEYRTIFALLPRELVIDKFAYNQKEIVLQGTTPTIALVQDVFERMKREKKFGTVELKSIVKEQEGYVFVLALSSLP